MTKRKRLADFRSSLKAFQSLAPLKRTLLDLYLTPAMKRMSSGTATRRGDPVLMIDSGKVNPVYTDIEGAVESVLFNVVPVLLFIIIARGSLSSGTKRTVRNNKVSAKRGLSVSNQRIAKFINDF